MPTDWNTITRREKICVIIPTYNNERTLRRVIDGVRDYTDNIIIINDGSTDSTAAILEDYARLQIIHLDRNAGKGVALRRGFRIARNLGFVNAVTIDSDGQHFPDDLPTFFLKLLATKSPVLLVGNRNMSQAGIPKKSSFGNRFSNFWYRFETGIELQDTQSGFRSYPLQHLPKKFFTRKFEFEVEVLVRAAWRGIKVEHVPVKVLYDPAERVSHFRPFRDFSRISVLNTVLVAIAIFYIKPRDFIRNFRRKSFRQFLKEDLLETEGSSKSKALSCALGLFIGIAPLWGFQTALAISLAVVFRLNKVLAFTFSHVSFPPFIPFIIAASLAAGRFLLTGKFSLPAVQFGFDALKQNLGTYILGSFGLATAVAVLGGFLVFFLLEFFKSRKRISV